MGDRDEVNCNKMKVFPRENKGTLQKPKLIKLKYSRDLNCDNCFLMPRI